MGDFMGLRKNFFSPKPLEIECFSMTYKAIVWQVYPCKTFLCSKSDFRIFFSEITYYTTPPPPQKSNGRPLISSLHMIGHISVLHNHCETHYLSPGDQSSLRTQKGGSLKTLEGFRGGTTQICLENGDMWWCGGVGGGVDRESHQK